MVTLHTLRHTPWYTVKVKLTEEEVQHRLILLRNLKVLYTKARERIALLEAETKQQKERIKELEAKEA